MKVCSGRLEFVRVRTPVQPERLFVFGERCSGAALERKPYRTTWGTEIEAVLPLTEEPSYCAVKGAIGFIKFNPAPETNTDAETQHTDKVDKGIKRASKFNLQRYLAKVKQAGGLPNEMVLELIDTRRHKKRRGADV